LQPGVRLRAERLYQQLDLLQPVRQEARRDLLREMPSGRGKTFFLTSLFIELIDTINERNGLLTEVTPSKHDLTLADWESMAVPGRERRFRRYSSRG